MLMQQQLEKFPQPTPNEYYSAEAIGPMLDRVYSMRYRSYSAENYIDQCVSEKFMDEFDPMQNCKSFLTYRGIKTIGSIRACITSSVFESSKIPVMDVFDKELKQCIPEGKTIIEANKFVVDPEFQGKGGIKAKFHIYKNIADMAVEYRADFLVAAIRPEHIKFYKLLNFKPMSDIKTYPHLSFKTLLVVCSNVDEAVERTYSLTNTGGKSDAPLLSNRAN